MEDDWAEVMAVDQPELARRLRAAREAAGLTQDHVANVLSIPRPSVAQIEAGRRSVSGIELDRLAKLYGRDLRDLLGGGNGADPAMHFRREDGLAEMPAVAEAVGRCIEVMRELAALERLVTPERRPKLAVRYDLPGPASLSDAVEQGMEAADAERRRLGLGDAAIGDIVDVIEASGATCALLDLPDGVSGLMTWDPEIGPLCVASQADHALRRSFSFAHEYGHVILEGQRARPAVSRRGERNDRTEVRANAFASALLMPIAGVRRQLAAVGKDDVQRATNDGSEPRRVQLHDLALLAAHFGVTRGAMATRLKVLGVLSATRADELRAENEASGRMVARLLGIPEPDHAAERRRFGRRFARIALEAFAQGLIDARQLEIHLALHAGLPPTEVGTAISVATASPMASI